MTHDSCHKAVVDQADNLNSEPSDLETTAHSSLPKFLINAANQFFEVDEETIQALSDYCG